MIYLKTCKIQKLFQKKMLIFFFFSANSFSSVGCSHFLLDAPDLVEFIKEVELIDDLITAQRVVKTQRGTTISVYENPYEKTPGFRIFRDKLNESKSKIKKYISKLMITTIDQVEERIVEELGINIEPIEIKVEFFPTFGKESFEFMQVAGNTISVNTSSYQKIFEDEKKLQQTVIATTLHEYAHIYFSNYMGRFFLSSPNDSVATTEFSNEPIRN